MSINYVDYSEFIENLVCDEEMGNFYINGERVSVDVIIADDDTIESITLVN